MWVQGRSFAEIAGFERMSVALSVLRCHVEVSTTGQSLVQRIPTEFVCLECDRETSKVGRPRPTRGRRAMKKQNYRLTRARRMVEYVLGILCNKWRIFHRAIDVCPDFCDVIVRTCCILHNFVH
jgi:hypothetical protein